MNKKFLLLFYSLVLLLSPLLSMAALPPDNWVTRFINNLLSMVIWPVFIGLVVAMFIYAGILFLTSAGDENKMKKARMAVVFAVVGIIVGILGYKAVATIQNLIPSPGQSCIDDEDCPPGQSCWDDNICYDNP